MPQDPDYNPNSAAAQRNAAILAGIGGISTAATVDTSATRTSGTTTSGTTSSSTPGSSDTYESPVFNPGTTTTLGTQDASAFVASVRSLFPWLDQIGLDPAWIHEVAAESSGTDEIMLRLRQTPQFKARFPGMYRQDGTVRMTEAQYMSREADYRNLLRQYGYDLTQYSDPSTLVGFFDNEMAPDELGERLETYRTVEQSSQSQRDAFYVYAGLDVTTDDLYEAVVDPAAAQRLTNEYNQRIAGGAFDYETWITRATEVGLQRVADTLTAMEARGEVTSSAVQAVLTTNTDFARQIMDSIYANGTGDTATGNLSLDEILSSFEFAAVGAAAADAGLEIPTRERLEEIRAAGVQRQQQIDGYRNYGQQRGVFDAASRRSGGGGFTQEEFEDAAFFGGAAATNELEKAVSQEEAAGRSAGEFRFGEEAGRLVQRGFGVRS